MTGVQSFPQATPTSWYERRMCIKNERGTLISSSVNEFRELSWICFLASRSNGFRSVVFSNLHLRQNVPFLLSNMEIAQVRFCFSIKIMMIEFRILQSASFINCVRKHELRIHREPVWIGRGLQPSDWAHPREKIGLSCCDSYAQASPCFERDRRCIRILFREIVRDRNRGRFQAI